MDLSSVNATTIKYLLIVLYMFVKSFKLFQLPDRENHQKNHDQK